MSKKDEVGSVLSPLSSEFLHEGELKRLRHAVSERIYQLTPGEPGARKLLFRLLFTALRENYGVPSYRDIRRVDMLGALQFISEWAREIEVKRSDYYESINQ